MTLFELNQACNEALENCIDPETGEVTDFSALEELEIAKEEKVKNCALFILNAEADINEYEKQEKKFKELKQALKNKVQRVKEYLSDNIDKPYTFTEVKVSFRPSEETVISDKQAFEQFCLRNAEYCTIEYKPNKSAIKQALLSGQQIDGAEVVRKQNIQIK